MQFFLQVFWGSEFADLFIPLELKISFLFELSDFLVLSLVSQPQFISL